jgi:ADP-ribosylglycohydrolase
MPFRKDGLGLIKTGFKDIEKAISQGKIQERHGKVGVWTDDASMGLCIADSILLNDF